MVLVDEGIWFDMMFEGVLKICLVVLGGVIIVGNVS